MVSIFKVINVVVLAILLNEICERYTYYSIKTVLYFYLENVHHYVKQDASVLYHLWMVLCYLTPIMGATIADSFLGKYKTILYLSIVYTIGVFLTILGAIPGFGASLTHIFMIAGLIFIAFGTGGIKPCISSFGADQYENDPDAEQKRIYFFTMFYIIINVGSLISSITAPILRAQDGVCNSFEFFKREQQSTCYSLAFFIPFCMLILSIVFFVAKHNSYYKKEPSGDNILFKFCKLIYYACTNRSSNPGKSDHWLDVGLGKFGKKFVTEIKLALNIMWVLFPLCMFWFIFDQKGSRWIVQASQMNCYFNWFGKKILILPEQVVSLNPIFIVTFSPVIKFYIIPALEKLCKRDFTPFGIISTGIILVGFSQLSIALFEIKVSKDLGGPLNGYQLYNKAREPDYNATISKTLLEERMLNQTMLIEIQALGDGKKKQNYEIGLKKSDTGVPIINLINLSNTTLHMGGIGAEYDTIAMNKHKKYPVSSSSGADLLTKLILCPENQDVKNCTIESHDFGAGAIYVVIYTEEGDIKFDKKIPESTFSLGWQVISYALVTAAEVCISITGLNFAYSQAPKGMKSLLQSYWLTTTAVGNLLNMIIGKLSKGSSGSGTASLYMQAGVLFLSAAIVMYLGRSFQFQTPEDLQKIDDMEDCQGSDKPRKSSHEEENIPLKGD